MNQILEEIQLILNQVLQTTVPVSRQTTADDVEGWDSLTHMNIITAVEQHFQISFSFHEITRLECVGDLEDIVRQKISPQPEA